MIHDAKFEISKEAEEKLAAPLDNFMMNIMAKEEAAEVQKAFGMSDYQRNKIKECEDEIASLNSKIEYAKRKLEEICEPFGGVDKAKEIMQTVEDVKKNFTCTPEQLEQYKVNQLHLKQKNVPEAACPQCGTIAPLTVTKCPKCGAIFEEEI